MEDHPMTGIIFEEAFWQGDESARKTLIAWAANDDCPWRQAKLLSGAIENKLDELKAGTSEELGLILTKNLYIWNNNLRQRQKEYWDFNPGNNPIRLATPAMEWLRGHSTWLFDCIERHWLREDTNLADSLEPFFKEDAPSEPPVLLQIWEAINNVYPHPRLYDLKWKWDSILFSKNKEIILGCLFSLDRVNYGYEGNPGGYGGINLFAAKNFREYNWHNYYKYALINALLDNSNRQWLTADILDKIEENLGILKSNYPEKFASFATCSSLEYGFKVGYPPCPSQFIDVLISIPMADRAAIRLLMAFIGLATEAAYNVCSSEWTDSKKRQAEYWKKDKYLFGRLINIAICEKAFQSWSNFVQNDIVSGSWNDLRADHSLLMLLDYEEKDRDYILDGERSISCLSWVARLKQRSVKSFEHPFILLPDI
jgi:hypothetical protein